MLLYKYKQMTIKIKKMSNDNNINFIYLKGVKKMIVTSKELYKIAQKNNYCALLCYGRAADRRFGYGRIAD